MKSNYTKLDAAGKPLPQDATEWAAVLDNSTQLIWTTRSFYKGGKNWKDAKQAASELELCGAKGCRLPTLAEWETIIDRTTYRPCVNTTFFDGIKNDWHWSSDPDASALDDDAWYVGLHYGDVNLGAQQSEFLGLACRSASASQ